MIVLDTDFFNTARWTKEITVKDAYMAAICPNIFSAI